MIFPYATDAPVYHWPISTIAIIVVNVYVFLALANGAIEPQAAEGLILEWGRGLHPLQWVTSNFFHPDFFHLAGNMAFLWVYGLVVEGKVGWWRFLAIYLGIGVAECAIEQASFLGMEGGGSFGASAIIFGLVGISMIWAPENEMSVWYWIGLAPRTTSVRIRTLTWIYFILEVLSMVYDRLVGGIYGSSFLHLLGAVLGLALGTVMVKRGLVDCQGWDFFTLRQKQQARGKKKVKKNVSAEPAESPPLDFDVGEEPLLTAPPLAAPAAPVLTVGEKRLGALELLRDHLRSGDCEAALVIHRETVEETGLWELPGKDLFALIQALQKGGRWQEAIPFLEEALERFPERAATVRLLLGRILITNAGRPAEGLRFLEEIRPGTLPAPQETLRQTLLAKTRDSP